MTFNSDSCEETYISGRCNGFSVRAVRGSIADFYVEEQNFDFGLVPVGDIRTDVLNIVNNTVEAITLTATIEDPFSFIQEEDSASSMTIVVPSQSSIPLIVLFNGTTSGDFNCNVTIQKSSFDEGQIVIPVHVLAYAEPTAQLEYVDLGLPSGTLWATCNVGASSPEEYGDYFAWGETGTKYQYYWDNYRWCNGALNRLTKYNYHAQYGRRDNKYELELNDDAAYNRMGTSWCIPTREQLSELRGYCIWIWTSLNGVDGYLVIGKNGNTIFLPAAGYSSGYAGSSGYYWTNHLGSDWPYNASILKFNSQDYLSGNIYRCYGLTVRAVRR